MMKKLGIKRANSKSTPGHSHSHSDHSFASSHQHQRSWDRADRADRYVVSERQILTPDVLFELRHACAIILKETGPTDEDYEAILNQPDPLEQYTQEYYTQEAKDIRDVRDQASASQTSLPWSSSGRKRDSKHLREDPKAANRLSGRSKTKSGDEPGSKRRHSKPLPPVRGGADEDVYPPMPKPVTEPLPPSQPRSKPPRQSAPPRTEKRASLPPSQQQESRPDTAETTAETTATNESTADGSIAQDDSTKATIPRKPVRPELQGRRMKSNASHASRAPIPVEELHPALRERTTRSSDEMSRHTRASLGHDYDLRVDREKRISQINPDYTHIPTLHPTLYRPPQPYQPAPRQISRPQSRASEILDNIRDGIRNYVQPRPSLASTRLASRDISRTHSRADSRIGSRADSRASSRPASRGSMFGSGSRWFGLRRKNSWSSFRSGGGASTGDEEENEEKRGRDKGPDLNRSLPPLPGLDQYKEPKMHIAMLARANHSVENTSPTQPVTEAQKFGLVSPKPQEIHLDPQSPDVGPTPPGKSNPRTPIERRLSKRFKGDKKEQKSAKGEKDRSASEPNTADKKHIASEMMPAVDKKERKKSVSDKKERKQSTSEKKERKKSGSERKSPSVKSPQTKSPEVASPKLNQSAFERPKARVEPSPLDTKKRSGARTAPEQSPQKSPPRNQPQPLNLSSPTQGGAKSKAGDPPGPMRNPSDASMVRLPFSDDDDSVPASRVMSMGPGFLDMEVQRRLKDGKISSINPTNEALEAAQKPSHTPPISHTPESKEVPFMLDTQPAPPMPHSAPPVPAEEPTSGAGGRRSPPGDGSKTKLLQRPFLGDRAYSTQTQASEARSLAALGVDRVDRDQPPVPGKSPRMLPAATITTATIATNPSSTAATTASANNAASGGAGGEQQRRRAASALGHYEAQRQALQPRESLLLERQAQHAQQEMRTREIVGAGALVGLNDQGTEGQGQQQHQRGHSLSSPPPPPMQPPPSASTIVAPSSAGVAPGAGSSTAVSPVSPQSAVANNNHHGSKWSGRNFSSPRRDGFRDGSRQWERANSGGGGPPPPPQAANTAPGTTTTTTATMTPTRPQDRDRDRASYESLRDARAQDRERLMRAISYEQEWQFAQHQAAAHHKAQQQIYETERSSTMPNSVAEMMLNKLRLTTEFRGPRNPQQQPQQPQQQQSQPYPQQYQQGPHGQPQHFEPPSPNQAKPRRSLRNRLSRLLGGRGSGGGERSHQPMVAAR